MRFVRETLEFGKNAKKNPKSTTINQLLKTRAEDIPELNKWIENRQYLSTVVINELLEMMGNSISRSILEDIWSNSG